MILATLKIIAQSQEMILATLMRIMRAINIINISPISARLPDPLNRPSKHTSPGCPLFIPELCDLTDMLKRRTALVCWIQCPRIGAHKRRSQNATHRNSSTNPNALCTMNAFLRGSLFASRFLRCRDKLHYRVIQLHYY